MDIDIQQYRMRVGLFAALLCTKSRNRLSLYDVFCIFLLLFSNNKARALCIVIYMMFIIDLSILDKMIRNSLISRVACNYVYNDIFVFEKHSDHLLASLTMQIVFLLFVVNSK